MYAIENSDLQKKWDNFKETLSRQGHPHESDEYFHGTTLACDISKTQVLCKKHDCAICSFSCSGIYFAPHSSKSNDYAETLWNTSGFKAILMCDILPGKVFEVYKKTREPISECPCGYDSVLGVLGSTTSYPELVVHNPHAVCLATSLFTKMPKMLLVLLKIYVKKVKFCAQYIWACTCFYVYFICSYVTYHFTYHLFYFCKFANILTSALVNYSDLIFNSNNFLIRLWNSEV